MKEAKRIKNVQKRKESTMCNIGSRESWQISSRRGRLSGTVGQHRDGLNAEKSRGDRGKL